MIFNDSEAVYELIKDKSAQDYIDTMGLTSEKIEEFCQNISLNVVRAVNDKSVEEESNPPLMASYFFYYLYIYQKLPSQTHFSEFYRGLNERWIRKNITESQQLGLEARLARFYASIMREFHFYHLVKESNAFEAVTYTLRHDIEYKIDVLMTKDHKHFGVQLRVDTNNSKRYADKKTNKNRGYKKIDAILIDFPFQLREGKVVKTKKDSFLFYNDFYIKKLIKIIDTKKDTAITNEAI